MLIKEIYLKEGMFFRTIEFTGKTLIFSKEHSQGKTTLIRLLLHSLGFNIPSNFGINFEVVETKVTLHIKNEEIIIKRSGRLIEYNKNNINMTFLLPKDIVNFHSILFSLNELNLIENILGAIYIDQTKGNIVLNRGDVIGNNHFSVERFVAGLQGTNIDENVTLIEKEQNKLKDYKSMLSIAEYKVINNLDYVSIETDTEGDDFNYIRNMNLLKSKLEITKSQIKEIREIISSNNSFINIIENYKLFVTTPSGEEIPVNENTIQGFSDNREILETQLKLLNIELKKISKSINTMKEINNDETGLVNVDEYKTIIDEKMRGINIDYTKIKSIVDHCESRIKQLKTSIQNKIKHNSTVLDYLNKEMFDCAEKLGVKRYIEKSGIFTNKMQNKSGVIFYKIIISFRIAFIKAISEFGGIQMPFIIDSLRNSELKENVANEILGIIKEKLKGHQVIVASVYEYNNFFESCVTIENRLIDEICK